MTKMAEEKGNEWRESLNKAVKFIVTLGIGAVIGIGGYWVVNSPDAKLSIYSPPKQKAPFQETAPKTAEYSTLELEAAWYNYAQSLTEKYYWMGQAALCQEYGSSSPELYKYCGQQGHVYLGIAGFKAEDSLNRLLDVTSNKELVKRLEEKVE